MPAQRFRSVAHPVRIGVAVPTYNEAGSIEATLDRLAAVAVTSADSVALEVLVIDDASPDGTADLVERWATDHPCLRVEVLRRPGKQGLGAAYVEGLALLAARPLDAVLQMDADGSHPAAAIPEMVARFCAGAELVVGSRYVDGGSTPGWSWRRRALSRAGNAVARGLLGGPLRDLTGGYNLIGLDLLAGLDLASLQSMGYGFLVELKHRALASGAATAEVPIAFVDRVAGESKLPAGTVWRSMRLVWRLRSEAVADRRTPAQVTPPPRAVRAARAHAVQVLGAAPAAPTPPPAEAGAPAACVA